MRLQTEINEKTVIDTSKVGYVRTSTRDQNVKTQINQLFDQGIPREHIFVDDGVSGATSAFDRSGFNALVSFINKHPVKMLYVFEISHIGRTFLETLDVVRTLEERHDIIVWSLSPKEEWTRTEDRSMRHLMLAIFSWVAEVERDNIRERTRAGVQRAKSEGKHIGRPFKEINWKKVDEYREKGLSWSNISRVMDIPYATLLRASKRKKAEQK